MSIYTEFSTDKSYKIGYALSGGFIKGFAHLGVMQALLEHDIKPDIISGVSAGALAGAFYADGNEPHQVVEYFIKHKFTDLTSWARATSGLFKLDDFIDFLNANLKAKRIEDLKLPLIITATDLDHGKSIQFRHGKLAERVAASCCMPVMFSPVVINGVNYVDGGVFKNLPVSTIRKECEKIIAINVSPIVAEQYKKNVLNIAMRSYHFMFRANTFPDRENCDMLIEPYGLRGYSNRELEKSDEIFEQGYKVGNEIIAKLIEEKDTIWRLHK
ncbi:MAG: patatin-like phospholipase family protein [Bacteroides sp.]